MTDISQTLDVARETVRPRTRDYLFGPVIDFLCLGGGSFIILGLICWFLPKGLPSGEMAVLAFILVTAINNPHFAHSYQMFYRNFREKAFGNYPPNLRWRYLFAGIVVPAILVLLFLAASLFGIAGHTTRYLGWLMGPMFFLTGWHYVKQGYGILMVDSAQAKTKFSDRAKLIFRINAYACWILAWLEMNNFYSQKSHFFDGIPFSTLSLPAPLFYAGIVICEMTTIAAFGVFFRRWRETRELPWNGILAYTASLYLWLIFGGINPAFILIIPTFHSLQYLVVVWRYGLNAGADASAPRSALPVIRSIWKDPARQRLAAFVLAGTALGFLMFKTVPQLLDRFSMYDKSLFGPIFFIFVASAFINFHHYFMDNVIWRRGNPDVLKYVFKQRQ